MGMAFGLALAVGADRGSASAQVFVVGEKTAEADVTTEFHPTHVQLPAEPLSQAGYMDLVRNLEAEQGFAHRELPLGAGLTLIANGNLTPRGEEYKQLLYKKGESAGAGERVAVTSLKVERDRIVIDVNGGPYAKHRFLSHISINDMPLAQQGPLASGSRITLVFEGGVPDVTAAEVKALLDPIIDFKARSASEAYANTLQPIVRDAVENHRILVGMDQRMVIASVGAPKTKNREHANSDDPNSPVMEEWIYGDPPTPIEFVRFRGGRVIRLEIAAIGKPVEVHDKYELGGDPNAPVLLARTIINGDARPSGDLGSRRPPTLAKPGEVLDAHATTMGRVLIPGSQPDCVPAGKGTPSSGSTSTATPSATGATSGGAAPAAASGQPATPPPCPDNSSSSRRDSPSMSSGTLSLPGAGLPTDEGPGGMPGTQFPGAQPGSGMPGSGMPGSGMPGSSSPGIGYPGAGSGYPGASPSSLPGSQPTLPGSTIPMGPNHVEATLP